jgi:hypothetical protein
MFASQPSRFYRADPVYWGREIKRHLVYIIIQGVHRNAVGRESPLDTAANQLTEASSHVLQGNYVRLSAVLFRMTISGSMVLSNQKHMYNYEIISISSQKGPPNLYSGKRNLHSPIHLLYMEKMLL